MNAEITNAGDVKNAVGIDRLMSYVEKNSISLGAITAPLVGGLTQIRLNFVCLLSIKSRQHNNRWQAIRVRWLKLRKAMLSLLEVTQLVN